MKRAYVFAALAMAVALSGCVASGDEVESDSEDVGGATEEGEELGVAQEALDIYDGPMFGGGGGAHYEQACPGSYVAIGTIQAPTQASPITVRQIALICGPRWRVEAGLDVPYDSQWLIWSSWRRPIAFGFSQLVPAGQGPRALFEPLNNAPGGVEAECDPGYALTGITGRAGALVDRISHVTCGWQPSFAAPDNHYIYSIQVNVGGWGGTARSTSCTRWDPNLGVIDQIGNGLHFRSGDMLDALGLLCTP